MRNPEFKSNKKRSWIEFFTNLRTIRFGAEGTRLFMQVGEGTVAFLDPNAIASAILTIAIEDAHTTSYDENIDGISSSILLANALKATYEAHLVDSEDHATQHDGLDSLIDLVNSLQATYNNHIQDSENAGIGLQSALDLATDVLTQYNAHLTDAEDDTPTAGMQSAIDLANAFKVSYNNHINDAEGAARAGMQSACDLANDIKSEINVHFLDFGGGGEEHTTQDTACSSPNAIDLASLITITDDLQGIYGNHMVDTLKGSPLFHQATGTSYLLASYFTPKHLVECVAILNDIKAKLNLHMADGVAHTAGDNGPVATSDAALIDEHQDIDTSITVDDASNLASLLTLVSNMQDLYVAHNADAILVSPFIHMATGGGDALVSVINPTTLTETMSVLNDLKAKFNLHVADGLAHTDADSATEATVDATLIQEHYAAQTIVGLPAPLNLSDLITITLTIQDSYIIHNTDAKTLVPEYHEAQIAGNDLASAVNPTTLAEVVTVLNDIKTKLNLHIADTTAHADGDSVTVSAADAALVEEHWVEDTVLVAPAATDLGSVVVSLTEMQAAYVLHNIDAKLATPLLHEAQIGGNDLASAVPPTTIQTCMALANDIKAKLNLHMADTTAHTDGDSTAEAESDATAVEEHYHEHTPIATGDAIDVASLIALTTALQDHYVLHDADAVLGTPSYHIATGGGDTLASAVNPTTVGGCVTVLNDIKAKLNLHIADNVAHIDGDSTSEAESDAALGVVILVEEANVLAGDLVNWAILNAGTGSVTGVSATAVNGGINFEFSAEPQDDCIISYNVFRNPS